jgi:hypothetical protein
VRLPAAVRCVPRLEVLEDRCVLSQGVNPTTTLGTLNTPLLQHVAGSAITAHAGQEFAGPVATYSTSDAVPVASVIAWGDGHSSAGTITLSGTGDYTVAGTNTYNHAGSYTLTVTLTPEGATATTVQTTATVLDVGLHLASVPALVAAVAPAGSAAATVAVVVSDLVAQFPPTATSASSTTPAVGNSSVAVVPASSPTQVVVAPSQQPPVVSPYRPLVPTVVVVPPSSGPPVVVQHPAPPLLAGVGGGQQPVPARPASPPAVGHTEQLTWSNLREQFLPPTREQQAPLAAAAVTPEEPDHLVVFVILDGPEANEHPARLTPPTSLQGSGVVADPLAIVLLDSLTVGMILGGPANPQFTPNPVAPRAASAPLAARPAELPNVYHHPLHQVADRGELGSFPGSLSYRLHEEQGPADAALLRGLTAPLPTPGRDQGGADATANGTASAARRNAARQTAGLRPSDDANGRLARTASTLLQVTTTCLLFHALHSSLFREVRTALPALEEGKRRK